MQKKILVVGKGFLGTYLEKEASKNFDTICTQLNPDKLEIKKLDVANFEQVNKLISSENPDYVINCSVRGDINYLQNNKKVAFSVNSQGPKNIAVVCKDNKIRFVHISTDSVFDGKTGNYTEKDTPNPINIYAESKLKGESEISKTSKDYVIARTNFYGIDVRGNYFFNWILNSIKENKQIHGFSDVVFSPLDVSTLSKMIIEVIQTKYSGILHLSSGIPISKYDFILKIAKSLKYSTKNIHKISIDEMKISSPRPKNTSLNNQIAKKLLKTPISIDKWIEENKEELRSLIRESHI
ncbi:SDR family oxidoreductase [Nitrosopumilus sp.]|nr:SDR family oxidoreductase [Nitrosopumilus sp.]